MNSKSGYSGRLSRSTLWALCVTAYFLAGHFHSDAQESVSGEHAEVLVSAEQYVLPILAVGNPARLEEVEEFRHLKPQFLRKLLTLGPEQLTPMGVVITGAIFDEDAFGNVDFTIPNTVVTYQVRLEHCTFYGRLDLSGCRFAKGLSFAGSVFKEDVRFERIEVGGHLDLTQAVFERAFEAPYAQIAGNLLGQGASFEKKASFKEISVGHEVNFSSLDTWIFSKDDLTKAALRSLGLKLRTSSRAMSLFFQQQWPSTTRAALTQLVRAGPHQTEGDADSHLEESVVRDLNSILEGPCLFEAERFAGIALRPETTELRDQNPAGPPLAWLNRLLLEDLFPVELMPKKEKPIQQQTVFYDTADWSGATISSKFLGEHIWFSARATFDSIKVGGTLWLRNCVFLGPTSFGYGRIGDDFDASYASFGETNQQSKVNCYGLHCSTCKMDGTTFRVEADFGSVTFSNDFSLCKVIFWSKKPTSFYAADVKGTIFLNESEFRGPANFILAHVGGNFSALRTDFRNHVDLSGIQSADEDQQSTFNADFGSLSVDGFTFFNEASFAGDVSFRNARIQNLVLDNTKWPNKTNSLRLEGLSYHRIRAGTNRQFVLGRTDLAESWATLQDTLRRHTPYSFDVYEALEEYFRREGQPELADAAFIEGKRRERKESTFLPKCWNLFLDATVGHGRAPGRAFLISLIPLLVGGLVFRISNMRPADPEKESEAAPYNSFWFSLDLFLPVLDLWIKNKWEPKPRMKSVWFYACLHKFMGWVLVPVGLAAFAGIIK